MSNSLSTGTLPDHYEQLAKTVRDFAQSVVAPVAAKHDEEHSFPYEVVSGMADMGLFGLPFPEEYGGMGGDYFALCLALEELGPTFVKLGQLASTRPDLLPQEYARELARLMVAEGYAWAYRHFSSDYIPEEDAARVAARGIWNGEAQAAWDFRAEGWRQAAGSTAADSGRADSGGAVAEGGRDCAIKGNITASGEKVYHTPGSAWYARTRIDESAGEAWFCTPAEAEAAGWRAAFEALDALLAG